MRVVDTERLPIKLWLENIEDGALEQAKNLANLPFAYRHVAIMPDSHEGYGMPIGGVLATRSVVVPNAVGVDIGCGMVAQSMDAKSSELTTSDIKQVMGKIREEIPVGFAHRRAPLEGMPTMEFLVRWMDDGYFDRERSIANEEWDAASLQLGTLGGGNHFIEIQQDESGQVFVMVHSGSRNLGKKVADFYNKAAVELNRKWWSSVPKEYQLAFLPVEDPVGRRYMDEMQFCVDFGFSNRNAMMDIVTQILLDELGIVPLADRIHIAHNYAAWENHFGENVIVHRKGATRARKGEIGIIPGSQGTASYIVIGLGNPESFMSCSHGAGRKMGRKEAVRTLNLQEEIARLDERGVVHGIRNQADLDEAAGAYKDINEVMKNQTDLVAIVKRLTPLAVIKG